MNLNITDGEAKKIAQSISQDFQTYSDRYDENKYPPNQYHEYKRLYSLLEKTNSSIQDSLVWKWGHVGKSNCPESHKKLITTIEQLWPDFIDSADRLDPELTFRWWRRNTPATAYITQAFITHLVHHAKNIPIIDQHNFRAMNHFIKIQRPVQFKHKIKPSNWNDICNLRDFMMRVCSHLEGRDLEDLDRFMMMYGRWLNMKSGNKNKNIPR